MTKSDMNAIITLNYKLPGWQRLTLRRMREYCDRIQCALDVLEPEYYRGFMDRAKLYQHAMFEYERVCFMDADCVISHLAPDIFAAHRAGSVWMAQDGFPNENGKSFFQEMVAIQAVCGSIRWSYGYGNMGVVLMDADHQEVFDRWVPIPIHEDQTNLNYRIREIGRSVEWMNVRWNTMAISVGLPNSFEALVTMAQSAYIAHAAGFDKDRRAEAIERLDALLP